MQHIGATCGRPVPAFVPHQIGGDNLQAPVRLLARCAQCIPQRGFPLRRAQRRADVVARLQQRQDAMPRDKAGASGHEDEIAGHAPGLQG